MFADSSTQKTVDFVYGEELGTKIFERNRQPIGITPIGQQIIEQAREVLNQADRIKSLIEEARRVYPFRHLNSLNTVGYKELFAHFDGDCTLEFAIEKIKQNSRIYSRKQMTWYRRDEDIRWFHPDEHESIMAYLDSVI